MRSLEQARLYTFVDSAYLKGRDPEYVTKALIDGGADLIQLRAKDWPPDQILRVGERLLKQCQQAGVLFVLNDYPELALKLGAPLVHVGQEDFFEKGFSHVAELKLEGIGVGMSTHSPAQALRSVQAGAVYVSVGPIFLTPTKPGRPPTGLEYVRWAAGHLKLPWFAIGGITLGNVDHVLGAGAKRIAVVSAILLSEDIAMACRAFRSRLDFFTE